MLNFMDSQWWALVVTITNWALIALMVTYIVNEVKKHRRDKEQAARFVKALQEGSPVTVHMPTDDKEN